MTKNWDELCDEEKSFLKWIQNNDIGNVFFEILKIAYMQGYAEGFQSKLKYSSEEQLQK